MKTLFTERLILRQLNLNDVDDFFHYASKPKIGPMAGWAPHKTKDESLTILRMMIKEDEVWGITIKPHHSMVGSIGLHVRNFDNAIKNQKELGYVIDDIYWGKAYMVEAVLAVLRYAFHELELSKVLCGHEKNNIQSKRVIEKTGFTWTHDEKREHYDHTLIDINMYELTKERYEEIYNDKS